MSACFTSIAPPSSSTGMQVIVRRGSTSHRSRTSDTPSPDSVGLPARRMPRHSPKTTSPSWPNSATCCCRSPRATDGSARLVTARPVHRAAARVSEVDRRDSVARWGASPPGWLRRWTSAECGNANWRVDHRNRPTQIRIPQQEHFASTIEALAVFGDWRIERNPYPPHQSPDELTSATHAAHRAHRHEPAHHHGWAHKRVPLSPIGWHRLTMEHSRRLGRGFGTQVARRRIEDPGSWLRSCQLGM